MAFQHMPDLIVPPSNLRCEAMTKPVKNTHQTWLKTPHRCVRRAIQFRDDRSVCGAHSRVDKITYWVGLPDAFPHKPFWKWRPKQLAAVIAEVTGVTPELGEK